MTVCTFGPHVKSVCTTTPASWWTLPHWLMLAAGVIIVFAVTFIWPGPLAWLWDQTLGRLTPDGDLMSRADRETWASARTLADLGELTARWIEGDLASQPGYCGPSDIEDPAMVPVLAWLNRAGFVTTGSQQGLAEDGWEQRAAVEGFADARTVLRLIALDGRAGVTVIAHAPWEMPRWRYRYDKAVAVTRRGDRDRTRFGVRLPLRHIRDDWTGYGMCSREAQDALCSAWQVTIIDPEWGRADLLWDVLNRALAGTGCPYDSCHHNHEDGRP